MVRCWEACLVMFLEADAYFEKNALRNCRTEDLELPVLIGIRIPIASASISFSSHFHLISALSRETERCV